MEPPSELSLAAELDVDALVEGQAHEVERLADGDGVCLGSWRGGGGGGGCFVGHGFFDRVWFVFSLLLFLLLLLALRDSQRFRRSEE